MFERKSWSSTLLAAACLLSALFSSHAFAQHSDVYFNVAIRGTGSATIHADVYSNPRKRGITTILAVHGFTETGSTFGPLSDAIFADPILGRVVRRVVSIDLPGHGLSSPPTLPPPLLFGQLLIEDNVSVVIQAIDILRSQGLGAQVIMGHSMGGLTIQSAQEVLLQQGSSLARHGIFGAILLAAVPGRGAQWTQPPPSDLSPFVVIDPLLGAILDLPAAVVPFGGGFTTLAGTIAPNAPTAAQVEANGWVGIEPITVALELVGTSAPLWRPAVSQNIFALRNGTVLTVLSFSQDVLTPAVDQDDLYQYLTGNSGPLYIPVVANDAVHSMFISNPTGVISALRQAF